MCLGIPLRIISIDGKEAVGELNGIKRKVRVDLIESLEVGNYVMVHAGFAIEKMEDDSALETLGFLEELEEALEQD
jgi:hydrogenase expression/formation protein HypC